MDLVSRWFSIHLNYFINNFLNVSNIFLANFRCHLFPKGAYSILQLMQIFWLAFIPKISLHGTPHTLNGIEVRTLSRCLPPIDSLSFKIVLCVMAGMLWIVVLLKTMKYWKFFSKGNKPLSNIAVYLVAFIMPLNKTTCEAPHCDIAAQTCTLTGCFPLPFNLRGWFSFQNTILLCFSKATVDSSLNITSSNSPSKRHCIHHSSLLSLFDSWISWQYLSLVATHPSHFLHVLILATDISLNSGHLATNNRLSF